MKKKIITIFKKITYMAVPIPITDLQIKEYYLSKLIKMKKISRH